MGLVRNESSKVPQYVAALSATLGALAAGTVLGFTSPTELDYKKSNVIGRNVTDDEFKWVGSLAPLGCLLMCIPTGFILDFIGRKLTMLTMVLIFTIGWALIIWANAVEMLMVGRFFTGMASGTFCIAAPLYTSEIAEKEVRGTLGSYFQLMVTVGILFAYVLGDFWGPTIIAIVCGIVPFVFGLAFLFMPESPIYALKKGNEEKARKSLQWLRGKNYNIDDEIREMKDNIEDEKQNPISVRDSLAKWATKKGLLISFGLMFFQQMSGVNAVIFYTSKIFTDAGSSIPAKDASIIVGATQVIATLVSSLIIDRLGRRILLLISASIMGLCAMLLGVFFNLKINKILDENGIRDIGWLPIASLSLFIIVFSLGFGPIPWMISSEVLPQEIKTKASSGAGTLNWFLAFMVTLFFADVSKEIGTDITFFFFMAICVVGTVFVFFIVPETKGKTFEEIQIILGGDSPSSSNGVVNEGFT